MNTPYKQQTKRIKEKFNQAKETDREFKVFGASKHKYQLGRTVTQKEVSDFEERYSIELPECYKAFIMEFCGISIFKQKKNEYTTVVPAPEYGLFSFDNIFDHSLARGFDGLLPLGDQGCTFIYALVLNGKYKGRVVYLDLDYSEPFFTYEDNFLDWYERWLDEIIDGTLLQKNIYGFANTMQGSEKELISKLRHEEDNNIKL